jgi:serine/threonine-protein kinase
MGDTRDTLLDRLKQRKLVRWTVGYLAAAWVLLQVVSTLQEGLGWSQSLFSSVVALLFVGLVVTVILAWYHGERGRQRVSRSEVLVLGIAVLLSGAFALRWSSADRDRSGDTAALEGVSRASIAVLPFQDLSLDGDQEYFGQGLAEEIINALAQVGDLRVAARTSTFAFAADGADVATIAGRLGVANVLEGSVQKSGDRVRITAQLIEAESGFHVWSDTFDRPFTDIFAIQDEIGQAVADRLEATLSPQQESELVGQSTSSVQAYEEYLLGRFELGRATRESLQAAVSRFERSIEHDPEYAEAHAGLADAYNLLELYSAASAGAFFDPRDLTAEALRAAERAIELQPDLGPAHASLTRALIKEGRWEQAEREALAAISLSPSYANSHSAYGQVLNYTGRSEEGVEHFTTARSLDPASQSISAGLGIALHAAGRMAEAAAELRRGIDLDSTWAPGWSFLSLVLAEQGEYEEAIQAMVRRTALAGLAAEAEAELVVEMEERIRAIERYRETGEVQAYRPSLRSSFDLLAFTYHRAAMGQTDRALGAFRALVSSGVYEAAANLHVMFLGRMLADDPDYRALLTETGIGGS